MNVKEKFQLNKIQHNNKGFDQIIESNQIRSGCSFCSCENCRYDVNSCAGICGYHADLVKPTFEFKPNWFKADIDTIFEHINENKYILKMKQNYLIDDTKGVTPHGILR